jgi:hypothetical protein
VWTSNVVASQTLSGSQLVSTVAGGTPPLVVSSPTRVPNLNASLLGGPITGSGTPSLDIAYTEARYLQLSGGTLTGGLTARTAMFSGALSASGAALPATGTASASQGFNSNPLDLSASAYDSMAGAGCGRFFPKDNARSRH